MNAEAQLNPDKLLTVSEIAVEMRADEKTVYRRIRDGVLKARKEGGRWLMRRSALLKYLDGDEATGGAQ